MSQFAQREFLGALGIYSAGGLFWAFMPFFVGLQITAGGMTETQAGALGSAYLTGFSIASLTAMWWVVRLNWRVLTVAGAAVIIAGLWVLQGVDAYAVRIFSVLIIGLCMGSFWAIAYRIFGAMENPDRSFAIGIVVGYTLLAAVSYVIGTFVAPEYGLTGSALLLSAIIAALALSASVLPQEPAGGIDRSSLELSYRPSVPISLALLGLLATGLAFASVWAFAERIGVAAGFDKNAISPVIAGNLLASAAGSVLATIIGAKHGRTAPLIGGMALFVLCILLLTRAELFWLYALSVSGLGFFVGFVLPYQMGAIGAADEAGRFVVLIAAAQGIGSALGAYAGGVVFNVGGAAGLSVFAAIALAVAALLFVPILKRGAQA